METRRCSVGVHHGAVRRRAVSTCNNSGRGRSLYGGREVWLPQYKVSLPLYKSSPVVVMRRQ